MKKTLLFGALALLVAGAAWFLWFQKKDDAPAAPPVAKAKKGFERSAAPVVVEPARAGDINVYVNGLGTVTPLRTATVRPRVDGELIKVHFTEGQLVKEGQLLAEIDPRPFEVQLMQAEGQMAKDQALLANARIDLERYQTLFKQDSIAKQQVDTQAALVRQYEGSIKANQSAIQSARLQLTYSRVTAPISGRLGLRQVDEGNVVRAGDATGLVVITQLQPVSVIFSIPQDQLPLVLKKQKLPVEAWDRENRVRLATGQLVTVDNQIDPQTGTVKVKAQFANEDGRLFPNQFVNARMLVETRKDAVTVPGAALQRGAQGMFVYVVRDDSTVAVRPVRVGPADGGRVAIESGVAEGERVAVDGLDRLREGAKVEVASPRRNFQEKANRKKGGG
ncbi:MAG TPA: MdtA/MuxA family multidrug efflux RND transporter periplasmic adaptor subunit [Burkholderiales bacterium]|nr:MdtA/MuxA family multidrug efflux RND transporter periplasmic adaptor subunit [Burkholderiales bacterium]